MVKIMYELWQYECCGEAFKVGDNISWLVVDGKNIKIPNYKEDIDYYVEYHSSNYQDISVINGKILRIDGLYHKYARLDKNSNLFSPIDSKLKNIISSKDVENTLGEYKLSSFIITLKNFNIRASKYEEVTFR